MVTPLTVYKASAGSGKTFTLATEYIKLVVRNPQAYRNILAVTFTNKATEEMKMRILSQLYGIWKQLPDSGSYMAKVCQELDASPEFVSKRAGMALTLLLHNYSYFRIMTIDTFFQSILRNLARELDLTANLRVSLNDTQIEEMAVDQMIDDLQTTDITLQWIMKYIMENISDDKSWNIIGAIKQFGGTIFRDYYKKESKLLNEKLAEKGFFDRYTKNLRELRQAAKERMQHLADDFFDTLEAEGLGIEDLSYGKTGVAAFFLKIRDGIFDEGIEGKRVADCLGNPEKWYKKTHPRKELIHALADGQLGQILRTAVEERPRQWRIYQSANLTLRHLNQLRLLSTIESKVRQLNEEANRFLLSDTQQLLHTLIGGSDSPFIFEKTGTQLDHIMIDEFQDTSSVQWQNFSILLRETMSHQDAENLIVGDVKQSIYRWRSGDWRLMNDIEQHFANGTIRVRTLDTNYRSEPNIIAFNNAFFQKAVDWECQQLDQSPDVEQLRKAYADVQQHSRPGREGTGLVEIRLLPSDDYQQQVIAAMGETISRLLGAGISESQIAILVRTNNLIPVIANTLIEQVPGINIVSDEAFRIDSSLPVMLIVQALRFLAQPDNLLAKAFIIKHLGAMPQGLDNHDELLTMPLYELAECLAEVLQLSRYNGQSAYLCAFFDHLSEFIADNGSDIEDFLKEWDETICAKNIQSDEVNGIRLISIHKSKGLEFDNVIIPFCDWALEKQSGNILWCRPTESPYNELPLVPVDYNRNGMAGTIYEADYQQEHFQNVVDNLNLLYVAFTRASHNLFVIGRRGTSSSRSAVIEQVLPQLTDGELTGLQDSNSALSFQLGTLYTKTAAKHDKAATRNVFLKEAESQQSDFVSFRAKADFRQSNQSRDFIGQPDEPAEQPDTGSYIQLGSLLHKVFSTIRTTADIDGALQQLHLDGILPSKGISAEQLTEMLKKRLEQPKVRDWFSDRWKHFNECSILTVEDGKVIERRPDRVMTDGSQWLIVDFKFGQPKNEHHDQVRQYISLLRQMGHEPVSGFLWYVYSNKIIDVQP